MPDRSRREFLKAVAVAVGALAGAAGGRLLAQVSPRPSTQQAPTANPARSLVALASNGGAVRGYEFNDSLIQQMTLAAVARVFGTSDAASGLRKVVGPSDVVGIKVASKGGQITGTNKSVLAAVIGALKGAGVAPANIIVWDSYRYLLENALFFPFCQAQGVTMMGTTPDAGYDDRPFYDFEVTGTLIWGDKDFNLKKAAITMDDSSNLQLSTKSYYSKLVTQRCTKLINMPSLTDIADYGINGCLVNLSVDCVDNNRRFGTPPYFGVPPIPDIYSQTFIQGKTVLCVMDALVTCFAGGPSFNANYSQMTNKILASRDPVAIDALCLADLLAFRQANNLATASTFGTHVAASSQYFLGNSDLSKIDTAAVSV